MSVGAVNKSTGDRIPTAGMPAIDDALDLTSVNPVQNAVITAALANKQDKTDNSLQTTDKTVVGAINEVNSNLSSLGGEVDLNTQDLTTESRTRNLYDKNSEYVLTYINTDTGVMYTSTNATCVYIKCKPSTTYTVSKLAGTRFMVATTRVKPANNVQTYGFITDFEASSITITTDADAKYLVAYVWANNDEPITREQMLDTVQIEYGSTATTYQQYIESVNARLGAVESGLTNVTPDIKTITASPDVNGFINLSTYGYSKNSHKYVNAVVVDNNYNIKMWKHSSYGWIVTLYTAETFTRVTDTTVSVDLVVFGIKA